MAIATARDLILRYEKRHELSFYRLVENSRIDGDNQSFESVLSLRYEKRHERSFEWLFENARIDGDR